MAHNSDQPDGQFVRRAVSFERSLRTVSLMGSLIVPATGSTETVRTGFHPCSGPAIRAIHLIPTEVIARMKRANVAEELARDAAGNRRERHPKSLKTSDVWRLEGFIWQLRHLSKCAIGPAPNGTCFRNPQRERGRVIP